MMKIKVFPASNGDSFLITLGQTNRKNILVDGGTGVECYRKICEEIEIIKQKNEFIDLLIITHIDDDHISGIISVFEDDSIDKSIIKEVWFNSGDKLSAFYNTIQQPTREIRLVSQNNTKVSIQQGITLESELNKYGAWYPSLIYADDISNNRFDRFGAKITLLSPRLENLNKLNRKWETEKDKEVKVTSKNDYTASISDLLINRFKEDKSVPNGSSIAFLLEFENHKILMLGDSHPSVIIKSLKAIKITKDNKLKVNLMKVSHHGSKKNTNEKLLDLIECKNFIISTDGSKHGLPHKECLARIINHYKETNLYFNYKINNIFTSKDHEGYKFANRLMEEMDFELLLED